MPREDDVRRIVTNGRARGLADDDIRALVKRYDERQVVAPEPLGVERGGPLRGAAQQARLQGDTDGLNYLREMAGNIGPDLVNQGKNILGAADTAITALGEVGASTYARGREILGLDPQYPQGTPAIDALGQIPGAMAEHYGNYLDRDKFALMMRDQPVGVVADVYGAKAAAPAVARGTMAAGRAAVPGIVATGRTAARVVKSPVGQTLGGLAVDAATTGMPVVGGIRAGVGFGKWLRDRQLTKGGPLAESTPTAGAPTAPAAAAPSMPTATPGAPTAAEIQQAIGQQVAARGGNAAGTTGPPDIPWNDPNFWTQNRVVSVKANRKGGTGGESFMDMGDQIRELLKNPTPENLAEAVRLETQRRKMEHITARPVKGRTP